MVSRLRTRSAIFIFSDYINYECPVEFQYSCIDCEATPGVKVFDHSLIYFWNEKDNIGIIRSSYPILSNSHGHYFEVSILNPRQLSTPG